MEQIEPIIKTLQQVLAQTVQGEYALALAGAHAKGCADPGSDIDFFLYVRQWKPYEERCKLIESIADREKPVYLSRELDESPWGSNMDFSFRGIPVETTVRSIQRVEQITDDCLQGNFEVIPAVWTSHGYYSYVYLSELSFVQPIDDQQGILAGLKRKAESYPPKLQQSIIERFMESSHCWLHNFHYRTAIQREDLFFVSAIVKNMVLDLVQVIFAMNKVYFKGDKKLERQLKELEYCPSEFLEHLELLLSCPRDRQSLERQRQILLAIVQDIEASSGRI